jgi:LPS-assembly lipoprotein
MHGALRTLLTALLVGLLAGCGFHLRNAQSFAFDTVAVTPERGTGVAGELARYFGERLRPLVAAQGQAPVQAIVDILGETREQVVAGVSSSGQVRELQLRLRVQFRVRTPQGRELISPTTIAQQRELSFNETVVLAKDAEQAALYQEMQADIVQQILRRVGAIKRLDGQ